MLRVGTMLRGIYRIDSYLSSGGFGNTYVATNVEFNERYAIKEFFMRGITQRDDNQTTVSVSNTENRNAFVEQKEKFKKEARRLRQLRNEHIVSVHDLFEENGTAYYVMDLVDGENLSERMKRTGQPLAEAEVCRYLPQILDALKTVHDANMWHLDLKPANIMVDKSDKVTLIDFGASKQLNAQKGGATTSTAISYTNGYAPREQMEQNYDKFGPWTDLYALGATLYNLLTNRRPPLPTDIDDDLSDDKHSALPLPSVVSNDMRSLILSLMKTHRMKRPQTIAEVEKTLESQPDAEKPAQATAKDTPIPHPQQAVAEETVLERKEEKKDIQPPKEESPNPPTPYLEEEEEQNNLGKTITIVFLIVLVVVLIILSAKACDGNSSLSKYEDIYTEEIDTVEAADTAVATVIHNDFVDNREEPKVDIAERNVSQEHSKSIQEYNDGEAFAKNPSKQLDKVFSVADQMPVFNGNVNQWLWENLTYPAEAAENGIQGRVIVEFVVEKDGSVSNVKVVRAVDPLLDKEAVRVIKRMPRWAPGKNNGENVRVHFVLPVTFKLTDE